MATRKLLFVAIAGLVLPACQTLAPTSAGGSCNTHECHVSVTVTDCNISLDPDPIGIFAKNVEIHWDIASASPTYTFAPNGIVVKEDKQEEFTGGHVAEQDRKFILHDKNTFKKDYKYTVNVKQGSAACRPLDPTIANN